MIHMMTIFRVVDTNKLSLFEYVPLCSAVKYIALT